jgi:hypothetical protein
MRRLSFFISEELDVGLKVLKAEHGTPEAESIRRALTEYLGARGVLGTRPKKSAPAPRARKTARR